MADDHVELLERYQRCVSQIWDMFDKDPLPDDHPAQAWIERLEALIELGLIKSNVKPKRETVVVEGLFIPSDGGPNKIMLDDINYKHFLARGFIFKLCGSSEINDIVGKPDFIIQSKKGMMLRSTVFNADMITILESKKKMGYALAGDVLERDEAGHITKLNIHHVAIMPEDMLSDSRCIVKVVE